MNVLLYGAEENICTQSHRMVTIRRHKFVCFSIYIRIFNSRRIMNNAHYDCSHPAEAKLTVRDLGSVLTQSTLVALKHSSPCFNMLQSLTIKYLTANVFI